MRKLTGIMATALFWLGATGVAAGICGSGPPLPPDGLQWPLAGEITSTWTLDCESDRGHRGVDISADAGSPVHAAAGGRVVFAGYTPAEGGGTTISIEHPGGLRSTYLNLQQPAVRQGDEVTAGQAVGYAGDRPLHFGLKLPGSRDYYFNPLELIGPMPSGAHEPAASEAAAPAPVAEAAPLAAPVSGPAGGSHSADLDNPAPTEVPAVLPQPAAAPPLPALTNGPVAAILPPTFASGLAAAILSPSPVSSPVAEMFSSAPGTDMSGLTTASESVQASLAPASAAGMDFPGLKEAMPLFGERRGKRNGADALPVAAFIAVLMGALVAARFTARRTRVPQPASVQPTAPR